MKNKAFICFRFFLAIIVLMTFAFSVQTTFAVTSNTKTTTSTTSNTPVQNTQGTTPPRTSSNKEIENIKKIIGEKTPSFIANPIIYIVNALENFRLNHFNNPVIFYSLFFVFFYFILRSIWRFFF